MKHSNLRKRGCRRRASRASIAFRSSRVRHRQLCGFPRKCSSTIPLARLSRRLLMTTLRRSSAATPSPPWWAWNRKGASFSCLVTVGGVHNRNQKPDAERPRVDAVLPHPVVPASIRLSARRLSCAGSRQIHALICGRQRQLLPALVRQRPCVSRTLVGTKREAPRRSFVSLLEALECVAYLFYRSALSVNDEALRIVVVGVNRVCIDSAVSKDGFDLSTTSSEFRWVPSWHVRDLDLALLNESRLSRAALVKHSFSNLRAASFTRLLDDARFDPRPYFSAHAKKVVRMRLS